MNKKTALLIPCYNEEKCIAGVIESITKMLPDMYLVIVNDASKDNTAKIVAETVNVNDHIILLDLPTNLGIGGAVQTAFRYAARNGFDYAVKVDGDGQHPANQIEKLLTLLIENKADMVIGSRFILKEKFQSTFCRRIGIYFFRFVNSLLIGQTITDNTSGFRAYNRKALEFAEENYPSFDYPEPEEVVLMAKNGFRIAEIPVQMECRQGGVSSISPIKAMYYMMKVFFAVLMTAFRPPVIRKKEL